MVKGHPTIIYAIASANGIVLNAVKEYITSFDEIADELCAYYTVENANETDRITRDDIKKLYNITIYGGNITTWIKKIQSGNSKKNKPPRNIAIDVPHPKWVKFQEDITHFKRCIVDKNPELFNIVSKAGNNQHDNENTFMAYWCQILENEFVNIAYGVLIKIIPQFKQRVAWALDGFTTFSPLPENANMNELITSINDKIFEKQDCLLSLFIKIFHMTPFYTQ